MIIHPQNHHNFSFLHFEYRHKLTELREVYISSGLYHFVNALSGLFVPLYFLNEIGYSLLQILVFLAGVSFLRALFSYPVGIIISKIGPKHAMIAAFILSFLNYLFLFLLPDYRWLISIILLFEGFLVALYPAAFHVNLSKSSHEGKRGMELSRVFIFNMMALAAGPFIGGYLADNFGFPILMIIAMVFLVLAALPLLATPESYHKRPFHIKNIKLKEIKGDLLSNMAANIELVSSVTIWSIFVFIFAGTYSVVGGTRTLMIVIGGAATYLIGKYMDKYDKKKMLNIGSTLAALIECVRLFARTVGAIFLVDAVRGLILPLKTIPYIALYYKHADEQPRMEYIFAMEAAGGLALAFVLVVAVFVNTLYGDLNSLLFMLIMGAISAFGIRLIRSG